MPNMVDNVNTLTTDLYNATRWLPNQGARCLEEAQSMAESMRNRDPAQDSLFDTYHSMGDGSGVITDLQAKQLDTMAYILGRYLQAKDTAGIRWLAGHPELLNALADLQEAKSDYHERLVAKYTEYCRQYREQQDEIARRDQERTQLITDLPKEIAALKAELEAMKRKK